jgi:uncharacterized membrane protein YgcG
MTPSETYTLNGLLLLLCDVDVVCACWWVALFAIVSFVQELQESLLVLVDELCVMSQSKHICSVRRTVPSADMFHYSGTSVSSVSFFRYLQHMGVGLAKLNQEGLQQFGVLLHHLANLLELRLVPKEGKAISAISCSSSLGRATSVGCSLGSGSEKVLGLSSSGSSGSSAGSGRGGGSSGVGRRSGASGSRCAGSGGGRCACLGLEMVRDTLQTAQKKQKQGVNIRLELQESPESQQAEWERMWV